MFEITFKITAQLVTDGQGQPAFQVTQRGATFSKEDFPKMLETVYQQEVAPLLRAGDSLSVLVHLDLPTREMERIVRLREDQQFEEDGTHQLIANPPALAKELYQRFIDHVHVGDVLTVAFRVQRGARFSLVE
jgi:hypothetical protein